MSDPTPGGTDEPEGQVPDQPGPAEPAIGGGDETARIPVEPEVPWGAPEPPRNMPWEAPAAGAAGAAAPPVQPTTTPEGSTQPSGVLSAATVGWVAPPPEPVATGQPGWVIASTGTRFVAYLIDGLITGVLLTIGVTVALAIAPSLSKGGTAVEIAYAAATAGLYFVYFVGFWTAGSQATPGMQLLKLRVANAADGKRLAIGPASIRWLALGYIFSVTAIIPALATVSLLGGIWLIVLLVSTATDKLHQGVHDRWAKSVVVRPQDAGAGGGLVVACLVIVLILFAFALVSIIGLIFLGSNISTILSAVGDSI